MAAVMLAIVILARPAIWQNATSESRSEQTSARGASGAGSSPRNHASTRPRCQTVKNDAITITCDYAAIPNSELKDERERFIVLNRFMISFKTNEESHMRVSLTFTNREAIRISDARMVYLAIDDDSSHNYLRRTLPEVDFRALEPGRPQTFSGTFLSGAFMPGHYTIHLWIPDPDPSLRFDPMRNLLLGSAGVADPKAGLNTLAEFTVGR